MNIPNKTVKDPNRRDFLKTSAAVSGALAAANIAFPVASRAASSETLKIGLVGCGGRGSGAALQALSAENNVVLHSVADAFEDALRGGLANLKERKGEKVQVAPENRFVGFDAYQKLIDSGVDVVLLASPPGFRPQHLKAAIAAGKHVFCEKPMAVDAPGVRMVLEAAAEAKRKNLCLASGFCWRSHIPKRETFPHILGGDIGDITSIYTTYNTGPVKDVTIRKEGWTPMELQVRNWYQFSWLSGDHIVEQAVHSLDMMAWAMGDATPLRATANGGRQARTSLGNIYDHFGVVYEYANGARGFHFCRQIAGCSNDYSVNIAGTKGHCLVDCTRNRHVITGEKPWQYSGGNNFPDMYQVEHNELFAAIRAGKPINHGTWMAQSTMLAILGRMAAYTGQTISWEQAMNSQEVLAPPQLQWDAPVAVPPIPMPGKTKLV